MSDDCPGPFIVAGYSMTFIGACAGIWYLLIWVSVCDPCTRTPYEFANVLLGFIVIFLFSGYMIVKMLFPMRTGPLLVPH
jgi:hypothetical protein